MPDKFSLELCLNHPLWLQVDGKTENVNPNALARATAVAKEYIFSCRDRNHPMTSEGIILQDAIPDVFKRARELGYSTLELYAADNLLTRSSLDDEVLLAAGESEGAFSTPYTTSVFQQSPVRFPVLFLQQVAGIGFTKDQRREYGYRGDTAAFAPPVSIQDFLANTAFHDEATLEELTAGTVKLIARDGFEVVFAKDILGRARLYYESGNGSYHIRLCNGLGSMMAIKDVVQVCAADENSLKVE
jgi:hypothetical protein